MTAIPRDARLVSVILGSMGLLDVHPSVLVQVLEFAHRYTTDVLADALVFADHAAGRQGAAALGPDDIALAIQSRVNYSFTKPPEKDVLLALATAVNSVPLPPVSDRSAVRLPPSNQCLTQVNYQIVPDPIPDPTPTAHHHQQTETEAQTQTQTQTQTHEQDTAAAAAAANDTANQEPQQRGTKRSLDEDDDYD